MKAVVTSNNGASGAFPGVQVANVVKKPTVNVSTQELSITATTLTITGSDFSTTPARNTVVFTAGAVGTVTAVKPDGTQLTVSFTPAPNSSPTALGVMNAVVTSNGGAEQRSPRRPGCESGGGANRDRQHERPGPECHAVYYHGK